MEKPPFQITPKILEQSTQIHEIIGEMKGFSTSKPSVKLRKENRIRTVHHSLAIEGNSLTEEQITAILENKRVIGPKKQIVEVRNALKVYDALNQYNPIRESDLLAAHKILMTDLLNKAGKYRTTQVGIFKGSKVSHMAPPAKQIPTLMSNLFDFLKKDKASWLIKACVFHYELEFIHPFEDGNGRMGRLWQQLLLMKQSRIFEFVSAETLIHKKQKKYYEVLEKCDLSGESTLFIEFSLDAILKSLKSFQEGVRLKKPKNSDRINYALEFFENRSFSRKDYLNLHKDISTATASRDLADAVLNGHLIKTGDKANSTYRAPREKHRR